MKIAFCTLLCTTLLFFNYSVHAQCNSGELEVSVTVHTDSYGYELYWQLLPGTNACGTGTIFAGGSDTVGCDGGNDRKQLPGGYGNFQTITEGPWCLTEGGQYSIFAVDDYADGGSSFDVNVSGFPVRNFKAITTDEYFTFTVTPPPVRDVTLTEISTPSFISLGDINVEGLLKNTGSDTINSLEITYTTNGGSPVTATLTGLNIAPFTTKFFEHPTPINVSTGATLNLHVQLGNMNGQGQDENAANDTLSKMISVKTPIPNIMHWYTEPGNHMKFDTIATTAEQVLVPRDLDFQPTGQLWVINKDSEQSGGSTVTFENPGKPNQSATYLRDANAWHFMSLPTAIAFSNNGNFATSPGVFDANHTGGGQPFTGPALWSSDMSIYAQVNPIGLGSHLDMLHQSPFGMGIASESENKFWVFDANSNDIVFYDFRADHGPGNDDHSDGVVRRYKGMTVDSINAHIPCHLAYDLNSGWLYIVDGASQRILRLDTRSGIPGGSPAKVGMEPLAEYVEVTGATWETVADSGLIQPAGIEIMGDRLIVSDYFNGDLIFYDISSIPATEMTRIHTGSGGVMGIVVGPDGRIWYVNANNNMVMRIEPDSVPEITAISPVKNDLAVKMYPVPADDVLNISCADCENGNYKLSVYNVIGEEIFTSTLSGKRTTINLSNWTPGVYAAMVKGNSGSYLRKILVE